MIALKLSLSLEHYATKESIDIKKLCFKRSSISIEDFVKDFVFAIGLQQKPTPLKYTRRRMIILTELMLYSLMLMIPIWK